MSTYMLGKVSGLQFEIGQTSDFSEILCTQGSDEELKFPTA